MSFVDVVTAPEDMGDVEVANSRVAALEEEVRQQRKELQELASLVRGEGNASGNRRQSLDADKKHKSNQSSAKSKSVKTIATRGSLGSQGERVISYVPNFYRTFNESGDGFDTTHDTLEKAVTCCVMFMIVIVLVALIGYYSSHTFTDTKEVRTPNLVQYQEVLERSNLVTFPLCECSATLVAHGTEFGGFIDHVLWELDDMCTSSFVRAPGDEFQNISLGISAGEDEIAYSCSRVMVGSDPWSDDAGDLRVYSGADCAAAGGVASSMLSELDELCEIANTSNAVGVRDWLMTLMPSEFLHTKPTLAQTVSRSLTHLAARAGLTLSPTAQVSQVGNILEEVTTPNLAKTKDLYSMEPLFDTSCDGTFYFGSEENRVTNWLAFFAACRTSSTWTGQCCTTGSTAHQNASGCGAVVTFDCTDAMVSLSRRLHASSYSTVQEAAASAFLKNGDLTSRESILEEPSHTASAGFELPLHFQGSEDRLYEKYFYLCAPLSCEWTETSPKFYALLLVVSGLIGGITTSIRLSGFCLTACGKQVAKARRSQSSLEVLNDPNEADEAVGLAGSPVGTSVRTFGTSASADMKMPGEL
mmetsp:Transcript_49140/g.117051  ORF Transcript_49140/g.117051 Transcript_49140/m.117051 type:complete len:587 (-) Transcript_49140:47-1807(-)